MDKGARHSPAESNGRGKTNTKEARRVIGHSTSQRGTARARKIKKKKGQVESVAVTHEFFGPLTGIVDSLGREWPPLTGLTWM